MPAKQRNVRSNQQPHSSTAAIVTIHGLLTIGWLSLPLIAERLLTARPSMQPVVQPYAAMVLLVSLAELTILNLTLTLPRAGTRLMLTIWGSLMIPLGTLAVFDAYVVKTVGLHLHESLAAGCASLSINTVIAASKSLDPVLGLSLGVAIVLGLALTIDSQHTRPLTTKRAALLPPLFSLAFLVLALAALPKIIADESVSQSLVIQNCSWAVR